MNNIFFEQQVINLINDDLKKASSFLSTNEYLWIMKHRVHPHVIEALLDVDRVGTIYVWKITDNTEDEQSSYHIAYNHSTQKYGIIAYLYPDLILYLGDYGTLYDTCRCL